MINTNKYFTKTDELGEFYRYYEAIKKEIQSKDWENEKEFLQEMETMILTITCIRSNFMRYYYLYEVYNDTDYEDSFYYYYSDFIREDVLKEISKYLESLPFKQRKALLYNTELKRGEVIVNKYIAPEYKSVANKINDIQVNLRK